ncbi:MAG: DUF5596 domain-containing protein [Armatimonadetes bacterium]|nr:DUF5596 domain-containing protein [Armatimonadota bacterium]
MRLEEVLARLEIPEAEEAFRPHWEDSLARLGERIPFFLEPEQVRAGRDWCGLDPATEPELLAVARRAADDPALRCFAWHCYRLLYEHDQWPGSAPLLEGVLGESACVLYLLITMGMVPRVRALHQHLGVPEEVTRETLSQVACVAGNYHRQSGGRLGVTPNTLSWMRYYPAGRLFRIGRFEYKIEPYWGGVEAYRHRETGAVVALALAGTRFDREGYVDGTGGKPPCPEGWTATLEHEEDAVIGYPICPRGMAERRRVRLPLAEWECVLKKGDLVLDMHIPAGGGMTPERCTDSLRRGTEFFRRYFPDQPFQAIVCWSWLYNTQLEEILGPEANLVKHQRELYLYPVASGRHDGLWFIFLRNPLDLATAPRQTSLQRAILAHLEAGNYWRCGGFFFLTEHLDRLGTQYYRSHWPPACLREWEQCEH